MGCCTWGCSRCLFLYRTLGGWYNTWRTISISCWIYCKMLL